MEWSSLEHRASPRSVATYKQRCGVGGSVPHLEDAAMLASVYSSVEEARSSPAVLQKTTPGEGWVPSIKAAPYNVDGGQPLGQSRCSTGPSIDLFLAEATSQP